MPDSSTNARHQRLEAAAEVAQRSGSDDLLGLLTSYYHHTATDDILTREPEDLLGAVLTHRSVGKRRSAGDDCVDVFNPAMDEDGWSSSHTIVQIVTGDRPFLVDSVMNILIGADYTIHLVVHPQMWVRRDDEGLLTEVVEAVHDEDDEPDSDIIVESWIHIEVDHESDESDRADLRQRLQSVLRDVRVAVEDWPAMRDRCQVLVDELTQDPPTGIDAEDAELTATFLSWLADDHFTFLGYREYELVADDDGEKVVTRLGTGLGLMRPDPDDDDQEVRLTPEAGRAARDPRLLIITKTNSVSTVHRPVHLDYISLRTFDEDGAVTGERRFIGLFASSAYTESVMRIPLIREKVGEVLERSGFARDSHSGKDLLGVLENYPRDELYQADVDFLLETTIEVTHLQERRGTKLFLRADDFGRFMSCLVYIPRDRYNTAVRLKMEAILQDAFDGTSVDYTTSVGESKLARLHYVVRLPRGSGVPEVDAPAVEQQLRDATRTWTEDFTESLRSELGEESAATMNKVYGRAFPAAYQEDFLPRMAIADLRHIEALESEDSTGRALYQPAGAPDTDRRFKLYRRRPVSLSTLLPMFTDMRIEVIDERPYRIDRADGGVAHVYDLGLRVEDEERWGVGGRDTAREMFQDAVGAIWDGRAESDGFNALVVGGGLTWREVVILRTIAKYLRQTRPTFSQDYLEASVVENADIAALIVELFRTRFDPDQYDGQAGSDRSEASAEVRARIVEALDGVASLDHDRILRAFVDVIDGCLRTNFYQRDADDQPKPYVSLKLNPRKIPDLPAPRPAYEIWVYSPRVEGVHLRFGAVARGGLRWSDRREDFRTEILGLVKAQMVKNAVIVPTGSKGGFYAKQLPDPAVDRDAWLAEGIEAYKIFISGLLDLTDNRVGTQIEPPTGVVRHDGDDPYLVVAADKGTATFSDIANEVSQSYGFWLDDAFASGGSAGYDHKAMGITARGAWESVKRHFRELGVDTQSEEFTVVGIGDMSGDVFGNGMLLSEHIRLLAAFDHRHIFVDPDPDAASSYVERQRLFDAERSSWDDYDRSLISAGGGVFPRSAKSITITDQMRQALDLPDDTTTMTPAELIKGILLSSADLLWNGGIGTYVKAESESHADIGDRANDAIRVDGHELGVKVVGEGGNLGLSQLGRIEAAMHGVRVNTDAIDNSAGVDTSDHEVNIKILLSQLVRADDMTLKQRNTLLASMTDEVAAQVLRDNYEQNVLLGNGRAQHEAMVTVHERLIDWLERHADLDRELEFLPSRAELERRRDEGLGLTSPEFSVLVAYSKLALKEALMDTSLADDPHLHDTLMGYFPEPLRADYASQIEDHPLRDQIIITSVANSIVNRGGITFTFRAVEETGASMEQVARAFVVAREIFHLPAFVRAVEELDNVVSTDVQATLYLEFRRLLDRAVRWFLTSRPQELDIANEVSRFGPPIDDLGDQIPEMLLGGEAKRCRQRAQRLEKQGVGEELARNVASLLDQFSLLDIVDVATEHDADPAEVARVYFLVSERFHIDPMLTKVSELPRENQWDGLARGALRDDLYAVTESLTTTIIASAPDGDLSDPEALVDQWASDNAAALTRARQSLTAIDRLPKPNIAALSVALRSLRSVVRTGAATS